MFKVALKTSQTRANQFTTTNIENVPFTVAGKHGAAAPGKIVVAATPRFTRDYAVPSKPREGVIIECPLNGQYHDARDVILTSRTDVREMVDDDDDDEWPLVIYNYI